ncbi:MAG: menaquinone biosynthesis protein [Planctomycetes bacterium]|nr:menaquinone biosynthesis protein [Planctomycetota bacterium]
MDLETRETTKPTAVTHTFGVVSYLNSRPLHEFLREDPRVRLRPAVPAELIGMLDRGECEVALLPVVDFWRNRERLALVSDGCIASDGETMTVRVFSKRPAEKVARLHVDGDSHTSMILAQVLWREMYGCKLEIVPWDRHNPGSLDDVDALLLIGDKVITGQPLGFGFEVDLGAAWKYATGLPFVFAAWYGAKGLEHSIVAKLLSEARDRGEADAERIARHWGPVHGWPVEAAVQYLTRSLKFRITESMRAGMERFFELGVQHGLLP